MSSVTLTPLAKPIDADVTIPGSKSYTIRALLLAALVDNPVTLANPLISDDTLAMVRCLNALGIETRLLDNEAIEVKGSIRDVQPGDYRLDADLSAASLRFLLALSAVLPGQQTLHGKAELNRRPVAELADALRQLGAQVLYEATDGCPPVTVTSESLAPGTVQLSGSVSSQYVSALLMIAPLTGGEVVIEITDEAVSKPYIDMTMAIMAEFGVHVQNDHYTRLIVPAGQIYQAEQYTVEADASSAAYFLALAALTRSRITLHHFNPASIQADMRFIDILQAMGNTIETEGNRLTITGRGVKPMAVDMRDCPDQAQMLAVLAAFAPGETRIEGIRSLRIKETNRVDAVKNELAKMGITVTDEPDSMTIHGGRPRAARIETYGDHRMAMAFAVAGAVLPDLEITDPDVVAKTFPGFWETLQRAGIQTSASRTAKIVLVGFMGSGKSLIAAKLAERLHLELVEMDAEIVRLSGRRSIAEIFDLDGEIRFRELEIATARTLRFKHNAVISTGGGIVMNKIALDYLRLGGTVVHLDATLDTVRARLGHDPDRPLLRDPSQVEALYALRKPLYRHYTDWQVQTDKRDANAIVEEILTRWQARQIEEERA